MRGTIVLPVPLGDVAGAGKPNLTVTFGIPDELAEQQRPKRAAPDERVISPDHKLRILPPLLIQAIEAVLPHLQQLPRRPASALIARVVVEILIIGKHGQLAFFELERIGSLLMLGVHPIHVSEFAEDVRRCSTGGHSGRKVSLGWLADGFLDDLDGLLQILFFLIPIFHVAIIVDPRLGANLVSLRHDLFKNIRIIHHGDPRGEESCPDPLFLKNLQHAKDPHALAEFPVGDGAEVFLRHRISGERPAIFLL